MIWAAGSLLEYKIVKASPTLKRLFHGVTGIAISIAIGAGAAFVLGAPAGAGVMLGQLLGLATNDFTFKTYWWLEHSALPAFRRGKSQVQKVNDFRQEHPKIFNEATQTIKAGFQTIGGIILFLVWLIGLPVRTIQWVKAGYTKTRLVLQR